MSKNIGKHPRLCAHHAIPSNNLYTGLLFHTRNQTPHMQNATAVYSPTKHCFALQLQAYNNWKQKTLVRHKANISSNFHRTKLSPEETGAYITRLLEGTKAICFQLYLMSKLRFQGQVHPKEQIPSSGEELPWTKLQGTTSKKKNWACPDN